MRLASSHVDYHRAWSRHTLGQPLNLPPYLQPCSRGVSSPAVLVCGDCSSRLRHQLGNPDLHVLMLINLVTNSPWPK